jgi:hypothetical protein
MHQVALNTGVRCASCSLEPVCCRLQGSEGGAGDMLACTRHAPRHDLTHVHPHTYLSSRTFSELLVTHRRAAAPDLSERESTIRRATTATEATQGEDAIRESLMRM